MLAGADRGFFKEDPDAYFSWALCLCTAVKGHLYVDLLPQSKQMMQFTDDDPEILSHRFEVAVKEFLNTSKVITLRCGEEVSSDHIFYCFTANLKTKQSKVTDDSQSKKHSKGQRTRKKDPFASKPVGEEPVVFILQDVELLPPQTQMTIVDIIEKRSMPVSFIQNPYGSRDPPLLYRGHFDIQVPFIIVALSTKLIVPSLQPSPLSRSFLQSFCMRIPLKLPTNEWSKFLDFHYAAVERVKDQGRIEAPYLWSPIKVHEDHQYYIQRISKQEFPRYHRGSSNVHMSLDIENYIRNLITALRMHAYVLDGPSTRVIDTLKACVKAHAFIRNPVEGISDSDKYTIPADVAGVVVEVISHQIVLIFRSFPKQIDVSSEERSHPSEWNELTAARFFVATSTHSLPVTR